MQQNIQNSTRTDSLLRTYKKRFEFKLGEDYKVAYMQSTTTKLSYPKTLTEISLLGLLRGALGLPIQHPFETIKTCMQSENQSARQCLTSIYQLKGLKGYYAGFSVNLLRVVSKSAYRWPLMIYLLDYYREVAKRREWETGAAGAAAGLATALVESFFVCPLQRLKVWLMTSSAGVSWSSFWKMSTVGSLFDGFGPVVIKQTLSWVSFLGSQQYFKQKYYQYLNRNPKDYELSVSQLMVISMLVCLVNTLMVMPADYVKTHFQKYSNNKKKVLVVELVRDCYRREGIVGFYRGGGVKMVHYNINGLLTVPLLEKLLQSYAKAQ